MLEGFLVGTFLLDCVARLKLFLAENHYFFTEYFSKLSFSSNGFRPGPFMLNNNCQQ